MLGANLGLLLYGEVFVMYRESGTNYVNISHESKTEGYSEAVFRQWMHLIG